MTVRILLGDCLQKLQLLKDNSVDAVVTDPPYGLSFMGKKWDYDVPSVAIWEQCLRVLKPGGHLLAFAGTRTQHRMAVRIEDAGFEIRDMIAWVYGSGFPKSLDVSKAIDKAAGVEREVVGRQKATGNARGKGAAGHYANGLTGVDGYEVVKSGWDITAPATPEAQRWQGWGTALKPSWECITVARKPLSGTVAETVLQHGTGALNVDGCRVNIDPSDLEQMQGRSGKRTAPHLLKGMPATSWEPTASGRWPANLIHDGSEEVTGLFPYSKDGIAIGSNRKGKHSGNKVYGSRNADTKDIGYSGEGSAARFFYCAKASKAERGEGNNHPTVKPIALMRYLCRLVCPFDGTVLDPFMGSGSTGVAATLEKFNFIGIELLREHFETSKRRIIQAKGKQ